MSTRKPLIYLITLNWNRRDDTLACLNSLQALTYPHRQLIVVDNGSTDNSVAAIQAKFSDVTLIETGSNLGFAGGFNVGIRYALSHGAEYVFLLNNDTFTDSALLDHLLKYAAPKVGVLAPAIFYADTPDRIWSTGGGIHPILQEMTGNHGRNKALPCIPIEREFLSGCALLIRREVFERVGLFDERFFIYYEDLDFCVRVRQAGYHLLLIPDAHLWHRVSQSSGGAQSPQERYYMAVSSGQYFRKHMRSWRALFIILYRLLSALRWTVRLSRHGRWQALSAYWRGLRDGWFGFQRRSW
jgi:hypothetical protein